MTLGRPAKYTNAHHLGVPGEKSDHDSFRKICEREGVSAPDKINEFIKNYNRIHGNGNPQVLMSQFIENPGFRAVPAMLESTEKWRLFLLDANIDELDQIEKQAELIRKMAKAAKADQLKQAHRALKLRPAHRVDERKALPKESDPGALRRSHLRDLWLELARPSHDRKGGEAHRHRRAVVINGILRLQELLPEYQRCQEYEEWLEAGRRG